MARRAMPGLALLLAAGLSAGGCASVLLPPPGSVDRVERLLAQGRAAEAIEAADQVPRSSTDYPRALALAARASALRARVPREALARGAALEASGKPLEAVRAYESALIADPGNRALEGKLAAAREALGRERERRRFAAERAEAAGRLETDRALVAVAEVDPADRDVRRRVQEFAAARSGLATIHLERAQSFREEGRVREASDEAELAARLDPGREEARGLAAKLKQEQANMTAGGPEGRPRVELPPSGTAGAERQPAPPPPPAETAKVEAQKPDPRPRPREAGRPEEPHPDSKAAKKPPAKPEAVPETEVAARPPTEPVPQAAAPADPAVIREALAAVQAAVRRGEYPRARELMARAESQAPGAPEVLSARAALVRTLETEVDEHIKRGIAKFQLEDLDGAIEEWGRALDLDPENAVALDYRKKAQGMLKRIEQIREEVKQRGDRSGAPP